MPVQLTSQENRQKYDKLARWYDLAEGLVERLGAARLRRELLRHASGQVLEVAVGTGKNFPYYPTHGGQLTGVDISPAMLAVARRRAERPGLHVTLTLMDAEALAFDDASFDTVVSSMSLCTFPDPVRALREMARVCRTQGRMLLLEHGRSDRERLARWQDRTADRHARRVGCHWNRQPLAIVRQAGLTPLVVRRTFFGIFHLLEIIPSGLSG